MKITYKLQSMPLFDSRIITSAYDRAAKRVLTKFGSFVRKTSQYSIRTRKKVSDPGKPPTNRTGILKKAILFAYNMNRQEVIIGPRNMNQRFFNKDGMVLEKDAVGEVLEKGGSIHIFEQLRHGIWSRVDLRRRKNNNPKRLRKVTIAARPYMKPAFDQNLPKLAPMWKNSVR